MNGILNLCGKLINLSFKRKTSFSCQIYFLFGIKIDIFNDNCYFYQLNKVQCAPHLSVSFNKVSLLSLMSSFFLSLTISKSM